MASEESTDLLPQAMRPRALQALVTHMALAIMQTMYLLVLPLALVHERGASPQIVGYMAFLVSCARYKKPDDCRPTLTFTLSWRRAQFTGASALSIGAQTWLLKRLSLKQYLLALCAVRFLSAIVMIAAMYAGAWLEALVLAARTLGGFASGITAVLNVSRRLLCVKHDAPLGG